MTRALQNPSSRGSTSLHFARVSGVEPSTVRAKCFIAELGIDSYWLPCAQLRSQQALSYWMPRVGELVAVLLDEKGEQGVVLCAIYSGADPAPSDSATDWHIVNERIVIEGDLDITGDIIHRGNTNQTGNYDQTGDFDQVGALTVTGSGEINTRLISVIGGIDSAGHANVVSGQ